ncbi:tetratricopeptide repeat protein [Draconibacterium orientale]|jgi:tetratricopeptide (TPR) repeat protein|uniref:tetratricopeptide repeat protein n=1 Tax=Draconibacterium orientale TaxID=1168034 RepID=UPI002A0A3BE8|nr:tetratricopeptide repeat protein [Draconibacterium orientale]
MHLVLFKNHLLNKAEHALNCGRYQEAIKLGQTLVNSRNKEIAFRANRLFGLALYKRKKYDDSLQYLEKACRIGNFRHDWYSLAMALVFAGKLEKAEEAFKNIYRTNVQPGYLYAVPVPGLLYQYLKALKKKQFVDAAKVRANELKQMFVGVGPDTTKQVQRGLPNFDTFLAEVEPLFEPERFVVWKSDFRM